MKNRYLILPVLLAAFLAGCGVKRPFTGDPHSGITLQYSFTPGTAFHYKTKSEAVTNMEMMGQSMEIVNSSNIKYAITAKGKDHEGNFQSEITVTEAKATASAMGREQSIDLSELLNKPFGFVASPYGKTIEFTGADDITYNAGQMAGGEVSVTTLFDHILASLPEKAIKIGDTWTDTSIDTTHRMGMESVSDTKTKWKFEGVESIDGIECVLLTSESKGIVDGTGQQMGMDVTMEGDMTMNSKFYFDYSKGRLLKSSINMVMEATVAMTGPTSMTIPLIVQNQTELKLIK